MSEPTVTAGTHITRQDMAAEAICSLLWRNNFKAIGETEGHRVSWFSRGVKPKIIRVNVQRSSLVNGVIVTSEWPNLSLGEFVRGQCSDTVLTGEGTTMAHIEEACLQAVTHVLEIFRDVLSGEGVAGAAATAPFNLRGKPETPDES